MKPLSPRDALSVDCCQLRVWEQCPCHFRRERFSVPDKSEKQATDAEQRLKESIEAFIRAKIEQGYSRDEIIKMGRDIIKRRFFKIVG